MTAPKKVNNEFKKLVYLILDNEADEKQKNAFDQLVKQSEQHKAVFLQEKNTRETIKNNLPKKTSPQDLADSIRNSIASSAN